MLPGKEFENKLVYKPKSLSNLFSLGTDKNHREN